MQSIHWQQWQRFAAASCHFDRFTSVGLDALGERLTRLDVGHAAEVSRSVCASPTSLVLALLYLDRLRSSNPQYLSSVSSQELFLVSLVGITVLRIFLSSVYQLLLQIFFLRCKMLLRISTWCLADFVYFDPHCFSWWPTSTCRTTARRTRCSTTSGPPRAAWRLGSSTTWRLASCRQWTGSKFYLCRSSMS